MKPILFPGLGLEIDINNVAFNILGKDIYWYGLIIVFGMLLSIFLVWKDKRKYGISWDDITTFLIWAIVIGIACARIYYVVFKWDYYSNHLGEVFKIWNGGIAIYGAIIGALITAIVFCKIKKISFLNLCDFCAPYLALAQSIGRWGNFVNREAFGSATNSFLRMGIFDSSINGYIFVHPTFLYESLITLSIFIVLMFVKKNQKFDGQLFYLYMILYGIGRAFVEGMRTDSLMLGEFRVSQILAILFAGVFVVIYLWNKLFKNKMSKLVDRKNI